MTKNSKTGKYSAIWMAVFAVLFNGASSQCAGLDNCASCPNYPICDACVEPGIFGMRVDRSGCDDCHTISGGRCHECTSLSYCSKCIVCEYCYLSGAPYNKIFGPVRNTNRAACYPCAEHCRSCYVNGSLLCDNDQCEPGYKIDANQKCSPLPPCSMMDCTTCVPGTPNTCSLCRPGYGTPSITDQTRCVQCVPKYGCAQCAALTQCLVCNNTTMGPLLDGSGACAACAPNCRFCDTNGAGKCDICNPGFSLTIDETCSIGESL
jgi:hypothetical protein